MRVPEELVTLRDGRQVTLRSPGPEDAEAVIAMMKQVYGETHFLLRYPEEVTYTKEQEEDFLRGMVEHPLSFQYGVFDGGRPVGIAGVDQNSSLTKLKHRATLGIFLLKEFCDCGLGSFVIKKCIEMTRQQGFEQLELAVLSDNARAIHTYEKAGFQRTGCTPRAIRLKDGTYLDDINMTLIFE